MNLLSKNLIKYAMVSSLTLLTACTTMTESTPSHSLDKEHFLVGTYTTKSSEGVYKITLDPATKSLSNEGVIGKTINPSYVTLSKNQSMMFAATESDSGGITSFTWDNETQKFNVLQTIKNLGKGTCHITLNPQETQLAIANYSSGDVFLFDLNKNTQQLSQIGHFKNQGKGPHNRQEAPHMHYVQWDNTGEFLYAVDLGTDEVNVFNTSKNELTPSTVTKLPSGSGPRHLAFHPKQPWVYVVNELTNTITVFNQNINTGALTQRQHVAMTKENDNGNISSAIKVSNDGKFIYAAVRGINKIAVLSISDNGNVTPIQLQSVLGDWPRDMTLSANQQYLLIANQYSNTITALKRNVETGLLTSTEMKLDISIPSYIGVFQK